MIKTNIDDEIIAAATDRIVAQLMTQSPTPLLTMAQAAGYLNVSVPAFKRLAVPSISIGTSIRFRLSDIDDVLNLHRVSKN